MTALFASKSLYKLYNLCVSKVYNIPNMPKVEESGVAGFTYIYVTIIIISADGKWNER